MNIGDNTIAAEKTEKAIHNIKKLLSIPLLCTGSVTVEATTNPPPIRLSIWRNAAMRKLPTSISAILAFFFPETGGFL